MCCSNSLQKQHICLFVTTEPGIYSPIEMLDFGILRTLDDPKTVRLNLINTGAKAAHITSVSVSPPNDAIIIDFRPLKLQPDSSRQYTVAHITFRAVKALHSKQWSGKIIVKTKNSQQRLVIPYQASVLHGSLVYNANTTKFFSAKALKNFTRPLTLTNTFNFSVVIFNISLPREAAPFFSVLNFSAPVIVGPQQTVTALLLLFHPNATQLHLSTTLTLHTNASTFLIPIIVYNGLLKVIHHRPEKSKGQMDFGTMGVGERRSMIFTIRNDNPVDLVMANFETNMSWAKIELLGVEKGNGTTLTRIHNTSDIDTDPLIIKPYHYAVFTVNIVAPQEEGAYAAEVWMFTQFEDLFIPITFRTAEGSLHAIPEKFLFEKVFPGKVPYKVLQIHSTFHDYMEVTQVTFQPQDTRFYFQPHTAETVLLQPQEPSVVGKIFFDSKRECKDDCYVGLPTVTPAGHQWLLGLTLDKDVADTDQYLYTRLQQKWHRLERTGQNTANVTIELDTNQVRGFLFSAQAHLHWPSLVRKSKLKFPLTQIGNITVSDFIVENTADTPVLVQVLPLSLYPNPGTIIDLTSHGLSSDLTDFIETEDLDTFRLFDLEYTKPGTTNLVFDHIKNVENSLGVTPHKNSIAAILQPAQKLKIKIGFQPRDDLARSSLILIRNNLTIMDTVVVTGQGCLGEMKFSNRKPGSASPLTFEMTEKHLKNCETSDKKPNKLTVPHFTVRRQFTIRNTGLLSFYVQGFSINESPCEGYGFKVLDCEGFEMAPNTSRKVDIAFTPDFTMSRIQRILTVHTSLGPPANYTLQATVPPHLLSKCSSALPRPHWEPVLYYSIICIMSFLFFCICLAAYFEGDRIIMADIIHRKLKVSNSTQTFDKSKVFDLRNAAGLNASPPKSPPPVSSLSSSVAGQDLRAAAAKSMIHVNGHVEFHQSNGHRPLLGSVICLLQLLNPKRLFYSPNKITAPKASPKVAESNSSKDSDTPLTGSNSGKTTDNRLSGQQDTLILDKTYTNHVKSTKKPKPSKRPLVESVSLPNSSMPDDGLELKLIKDPSIPSAAKKTAEAEEDPRDLTPEAADDYLDDDISPKMDSSLGAKLSAGKLRGKKLRGKTRGERDSLKEKLIRRDNSIPDDKDETSSTTTDSSAGGEQDDKNSNARDSTPEPYIPLSMGTSKKSKKNKQDKVVAAVFNGDVNDDDNNFELTSKSKAHRKIRVNPKIYGGDIMRPSTLELDYTLPKEKEKNGSATSADPPRRSKKARTQPKGDPLLCTVEVDDSDRDSPPPDWDQPTSCSPIPGDLSELSIQTETFAQRAGNSELGGFGVRSGGGHSPEQLSGSSRPSSYSSIVSAATLGSPASAAQSDTPLSSRLAARSHPSPLGDGSRFPPGFPPYSDPALSGLAAPKTGAGLPASGARPNGWTNMPANLPPNAASLGSGFGLQTIEENTAPFFGMQPSADGFAKPDYFGAGGDNYLQYSDGSDHSLTMMQQLQAERRQRFFQFQKRKKENWPGFDVPPIRNDSLWDTDYNPLDPHKTWTSPSEPPATSSSGGFWSTLTNSASSGWNSLQNLANIWSPSTPTPITQSPPTPPSPLTPPATPVITTTMAHNSTLRPEAPPFTASDSQPGFVSTAAASAAAVAQPLQVSSSNTFSPFSTPMADIWKPASTSNCGDTTWGQFLPPPVKDDK